MAYDYTKLSTFPIERAAVLLAHTAGAVLRDLAARGVNPAEANECIRPAVLVAVRQAEGISGSMTNESFGEDERILNDTAKSAVEAMQPHVNRLAALIVAAMGESFQKAGDDPEMTANAMALWCINAVVGSVSPLLALLSKTTSMLQEVGMPEHSRTLWLYAIDRLDQAFLDAPSITDEDVRAIRRGQAALDTKMELAGFAELIRSGAHER